MLWNVRSSDHFLPIHLKDTRGEAEHRDIMRKGTHKTDLLKEKWLLKFGGISFGQPLASDFMK